MADGLTAFWKKAEGGFSPWTITTFLLFSPARLRPVTKRRLADTHTFRTMIGHPSGKIQSRMAHGCLIRRGRRSKKTTRPIAKDYPVGVACCLPRLLMSMVSLCQWVPAFSGTNAWARSHSDRVPY
ncbi:hypothetical protein BJX68DRAFT_245257 [Aspergillus pseudodeflectus]|uniref:Uncharacterized protein n=1 Tax=Aspergillus pseudodeflectus TaxID=176178 RepID=A0ABR4JNM0_9EURO